MMTIGLFAPTDKMGCFLATLQRHYRDLGCLHIGTRTDAFRERRYDMEDTPRDNTGEIDCAVTVYDGSWMTCDMLEEDSDESP